MKKTAGGVVRLYLWDGAEEVLEFTASGAVARRIVYGPGIDQPVVTWGGSAVWHSTRRFYRADRQGSIVALTDQDGAVVSKYAYDAFGSPQGPDDQPLRYTGRRWEAETGLYYYRARYYSPTLGRFLSPDPIGTAGGMNLYSYVGNNPTNFADPSGHYTVCTTSGNVMTCTAYSDDLSVRLAFSTAERNRLQDGSGGGGLGGRRGPGPNPFGPPPPVDFDPPTVEPEEPELACGVSPSGGDVLLAGSDLTVVGLVGAQVILADFFQDGQNLGNISIVAIGGGGELSLQGFLGAISPSSFPSSPGLVQSFTGVNVNTSFSSPFSAFAGFALGGTLGKGPFQDDLGRQLGINDIGVTGVNSGPVVGLGFSVTATISTRITCK